MTAHRCALAAGLLALTILLALPTARAADALATFAGPTRCRFAPPEGLMLPSPGDPQAAQGRPSTRSLRWFGACRDGFAHGRGLLRVYEGGRVARSFFGEIVAGWPTLGVIEQDGGYIAGRFEHGRAVNDGDRSQLIAAFNTANAAALELAAGYRKAGNLASARHYRLKAEQLAQQLD